jgi:hypothetical protein
MPNDIPDWTGQNLVELVGASGAFLGDLKLPGPPPDKGSIAITASAGFADSIVSAISSYRPAIASVITQVGNVGALALGTNVSVSPLFGQGTTAGNLLVAWVTSTSDFATTGAAGWLRDTGFGAGGERVTIFSRPNCGAAEAAPVFTAAAGTRQMHAQLAEFAGALLAGPNDQVGNSSSPTSPVAPFMLASDVAFGDLVIMCSRWPLDRAAVATFSESLNNGAQVVHVGDTGAAPRPVHSSFCYGIIPAPSVAIPFGVQPWPYDLTGTSTPATGSMAVVTFAANATKAYTVTLASWSLLEGGAAVAFQTNVLILLGATTAYIAYIGTGTAVLNTEVSKQLVGCAYKSLVNQSVTIEAGAAIANIAQAVSAAAYLR